MVIHMDGCHVTMELRVVKEFVVHFIDRTWFDGSRETKYLCFLMRNNLCCIMET